ncbi:sigma-70-like protein [Haloactinopolyspora alba]|uniref:Sigma-70-like protein n=1 Tax=Haloactinopolyspora alba TaxID=648780 RepID=A0A2P8E3W8_9ACTN|nr:sigma factor-like helix-turn-helix DNA-binding protein [Haloactinopolyspora alba]PSL04164.1 sigma-70-like protein [Haloactinopolyspora alba]
MTVATQHHYGDQFSYGREQVEDLLPGLWDPEYAYGTRTSEGEPEPGMPKGSEPDPRKSVDWIAHMCDIQIAWANSSALTPAERAAIFLRHGMHWGQARIAELQGVSESTISRRIDSGIQALIAFLDGEEHDQ